MNSKSWRNTIVGVIAAFSIAISVDHALAQKGGRRPILILTEDGQVVVKIVGPKGANDVRVIWGGPGVPEGGGYGYWTKNGQEIPKSRFQFGSSINDIHFSTTGRVPRLPPIPAPPGANDVEIRWEENGRITEGWWTRDGQRMDRIPLAQDVEELSLQFNRQGSKGAQPSAPSKISLPTLESTGQVKIDISGTGETIGHIADLKIQNTTDQPLTCAIPPMILESGSGKNQHYACPVGQTVALNPHQTKTVPVNGVCLNRNKPPVGKGVSGDLVINEASPSAPQNPNSHILPADAGKLLRICTSKYDAADKLQKDGALKALPYKEKQKQKDIVVQWSTWCDPRIAQITGAPPATKEDLRKVVYKQAEAKGPISPETKRKVDQGIDTIFEKVELTTAKAKDLEKPGEEIPAVAAPAVGQAPAGGVPVAAPRRGTLHPCEPQLKLGDIEGPDELEVGQEKDYSVEVTSDCGNCYETDGEGGIIAGTFKACEKKLTYKWTYTPHQIGVAGDIEYTGGTEDTKSKIKGKKAGEVLLSFKVWLECEKQSDRCYKMTSDEKKKVITVVPKK